MVAVQTSGEESLWSGLEGLMNEGFVSEFLKKTINEGWRPLLMYFPDEPVSHSVDQSTAKSIIGFHTSLAKGYAYICYGKASLKCLKPEDRDILDIRYLITDGSSGVAISREDMKRLIEGIISKMKGGQITAVAIIFILAYFSRDVTNKWISETYSEKSQTQDSSERIRMSEEETKRLSLFSDATNKHTEAKTVIELSNESKEFLVKSVVNAGKANIIDVPINSEEAQVILSKPKEENLKLVLKGFYRVVEIDNEIQTGYTARLVDISTGTKFSAEINKLLLPNEDVILLFKSLKDETKIYLTINALVQADKVNSALVMKVSNTEH